MGVGNSILINTSDLFGNAASTKALDVVPKKVIPPPNYFYGPQFVVNSDGKSLESSFSDTSSVGSFTFHGYANQQWVIQEDGGGGAALLSKSAKTYLAPKSNNVDSPLILTNVPYYWTITKDAGGFKLAIPNANLGLSLGDSVVIRPFSEVKSVYVLGNSPENQSTINSGLVAKSKPATPNQRSLPPNNITIKLNDLTLSGKLTDKLKELEKFVASGNNNLVIIGNQPATGSVSNRSGPIEPEPSTGFPTGYFRIRATGTPTYWTPRNYETHQDGNAMDLWSLNTSSQAHIFYLNSKGNLCCGPGLHVDVVGNTVINAQSRPVIQSDPNPWTHPLPIFSYSKDTKIITVKFNIDPVVSPQWPRAETEWKGKEFVLAARSVFNSEAPTFQQFSKWAPISAIAASRWTVRAGSRSPAKDPFTLGVEPKATTIAPADLDRYKWDIESV